MNPQAFLSALGVDDLTEPGPGAAITVLENGTFETWCGGFADLENNVLVHRQSSFHVASLAKQFTAFLIASFVNAGHLSIDDEIGRYLEWLQAPLAHCRIRHLLFHTSGIRDQWALGYFSGLRNGDQILTADVVKWLAQETTLNFEPGSRFLYSNSGYTLLALIAEQLAGIKFDELAERDIFRPFGMTHTTFVTKPGQLIPNRVRGYRRADAGLVHADPPYAVLGSSCLRTTVDDMHKWLAPTPNQAIFRSVREVGYFEPGSLDDGTALRYGYGLIHSTVGNVPVLMHGGFDYGFNAFCIRSVTHPLALFAVGNGGFTRLEEMAKTCFNTILMKASNGHTVDVASAGNTDFTSELPYGVFANSDFSDVRSITRRDDGRLWLDWMQGFEITRLSETRFVLVGTSVSAYIVRSDGNVAVVFENGSERVRLEQVETDPSASRLRDVNGKYYAEMVNSVIVIDNTVGPTITVGRNDTQALQIINRHIGQWNGYWVRFIRSDDRVIGLEVSHPRCLRMVFRRVSYLDGSLA